MTKDFRSQTSLKTIGDVQAAADVGLPVDLPRSSYELLSRSTKRQPDGAALSFFLDAGSHKRAVRWSYRQLLEQVTKTANFLIELGVEADDVTALMLPNLPETFAALWGGETAGIVMPVNPLLEPASIAALLNTAKAKVLITLAPFPGTDLYEKATAIAPLVPSLEHVVLVDLAHHVHGCDGSARRT